MAAIGNTTNISYADPEQGHHGGIYQAGNWIYRGLSAGAMKIWYKGKWSHKKTVDDSGVDQSGMKKRYAQGKHTYLMPLDRSMRKAVQYLSKPYPHNAGGDAAMTINEGGG